MTVAKLATLLVFTLLPLGTSMAAEVVEAPEEIVVTGHLPGPPLWKVSKGENVLWIFPLLAWVPKDMFWENERVARVIAQSQEFLSLPQGRTGPPAVVRLNPISVARLHRLEGRLERNPDGGTLEENLPPELYARFAALKARYFPANHAPLEMRPHFAGLTMMYNIRKQEGLVSGDDVLKTIQRLVRRNRDIKHTEISVIVDIGDNFGEFAERYEVWVASFPPEQEQACFEQQVRHMEEDLDEMKSLADSWAQGYIGEFRNVEPYNPSLVLTELTACAELGTGSASTERETAVGMSTRAYQMWLSAAENALATNASTFAILPIHELVAEDGLLSELKAKGYEVTEP